MASRLRLSLFSALCTPAALFSILAVPSGTPSAVRSERGIDLPRRADLLPGTLVRVTVEDPVYRARKRYEGIPLMRLIEKIPDFSRARTSASEVVFHCRDGYRPTMPLSLLLRSKGVLAIRDLDAGNAGWLRFEGAAGPTSPGPYYVVWEGVSSGDHSYPWPYQVQRIEIVPLEEAFRDAAPGGEPKARAGFAVFRDYCLKCHSINLVGGTMGSELNVPRSVIEYWKEHDLRTFIHDPASIRARSRMPAMKKLSHRDLDLIMAYLKSMSRRKICASGAECGEKARTGGGQG